MLFECSEKSHCLARFPVGILWADSGARGGGGAEERSQEFQISALWQTACASLQFLMIITDINIIKAVILKLLLVAVH